MDKKFAVSLLVNNVPGVMNRIGGIYSKRNYNISSFSGGETEDPRYTRITVVSTGDEYMKDQVLRQLEKLYDVRSILVLDAETAVIAQHMFIKIDVTGTERGSTKHQAVELINEYAGKIIDFGESHVTVELSGSKEKMDDFISKVKKFGILEVSRSGDVAIGLGRETTMSAFDDQI